MDLAQLRALRKSDGLDKIAKAIEKQNSTNSYDDPRMWKVAADKVGNGSAVIRFLPAINDDDLPFVKLYTHGFQGPTGKWYIENCRTTIGEADPVVEHCNELWKGTEADKEIARKRKRKTSFYANVLVISDPANPENDGKVFIFQFGKKIMDKITDKRTPAFADIKAVNVFHPYFGATFRLRMRKVDGYANFDQSEFDAPTAITEDDEEMLGILSKRHDLSGIVSPDKFKSYDDLKAKMDSILNPSGRVVPTAANTMLSEDEAEFDNRAKAAQTGKVGKSKAEPGIRTQIMNNVADDVPFDTGDGDMAADEMAYFRDIVND